jgi:hypothetical protein
MTADPEQIKANLRKLNARAIQAKMDLHDLSEELPVNWEQILPIAQRCHEAHVALVEARKTAGVT